MNPDTIFETEAWGRFIEKRYHQPYTPLRLTLRSGQRVTIPACRVEQRFGLWGVYRAMPPDLFSNLQTSAPLTLPVVLEVFDQLSRRPNMHSLTLALHPLHPAAAVLQALPDEYVLSRQGATRLLPLGRPFSDVWERDICKQHRRKIRTAAKRGLTVAEDNTEAGLEAYYPLYVESCLRLGLLATEPIEYFYDLRALLGQHYQLLLARAGSEAAAGLIVFPWQDKIFAYQIASAARYWDYFPNHLLFSVAIERACAANAAYIDFLPTGDHQGPELFKERFGAQRLPYRIYRVHNRLYAAAVELKDRLTGAERPAPVAVAPPAPPDDVLEPAGEGE